MFWCRVKKKKTKKLFKKNKNFFSLVCLSFSQISRHFHQRFFSFEKKKKKKLKKKKKKEKTKNTEEPQNHESLLLEPHLSTRNKSDHRAFKRRGVEEAYKKISVI